jgi:hypothetical protein
MTGAAPVPVPPPIPAVINTISVSISSALIASRLSSAAFLPVSGFAPAPSHLVIFRPILIVFSAKEVASTCASVLTATNSTPSNHSFFILLTVLQPAPHTPNTLIFAPGSISGITS